MNNYTSLLYTQEFRLNDLLQVVLSLKSNDLASKVKIINRILSIRDGI